MKRILSLILTVLLLTGSIFSSADTITKINSHSKIKIMADGKYIDFKTNAIIKGTSILIPLRTIFEALGANVHWDKPTRNITVTYNDQIMIIDGTTKNVTLSNSQVTSIKKVTSVNNVTMVDSKLIDLFFSADVKMDSSINTLLINTPFKPVYIYTFNEYIKFDAIPKRTISMNLHTTEQMMALGLASKIIGTAYNNATILPQYEEVFNKIPKIAEKYPSFEVLLDAEPDFVFGRSSVFTSKNKCASMKDVLDEHIKVYVSKASYTNNADFNDVYEDFYNLGKIFNIENKAALLVEDMKKKAAVISAKVNVIRPVKIFVYDFGDDQAFTAGKSLETYIIQAGGGKNIFDDIDKTWSYVNWETVVDRNPDMIVINDYGKTSAKDKINFLKSNPMLATVNAIKNDQFVIVSLPGVFPSERVIHSLEKMAKGFHPELFD